MKIHSKAFSKIVLLSASLLVISAIGIYSGQNKADALSGWKAGNIISDGVMTNKKTMTASKIQTFLNSKVPKCDTNGIEQSEYGGGTRAQYGQKYHNQSTFTCLRDYRENGKSAAQIIYDTAQKYSINPQVLLVVLQKEQGLVTDEWPVNIQYKTATGYGCPDTAPCDSEYFGLTNQLDWTGKMFRAILNNSPNWYTPYELGRNYVQYSPDSSCGGSTITIENRSTQALYNYTPYQPNKGSLDAGLGSASCGAYGNRNFYIYFNNWFGSTRIIIKGSIKTFYDSYDGLNRLGSPVNNEKNDGNGLYWQQFDKGYIIGKSDTGYWAVKGSIKDFYKSYSGLSKLGAPLANEKGLGNGVYTQQFAKGYIVGNASTGYRESRGSIRNYWLSKDAHEGSIGLPTSSLIELKGGKGGWYQRYEGAYIIGNGGTGYWESYGAIRDYWLANGGRNGNIGYPTGSVVEESNGDLTQLYTGGSVRYQSSSRITYFTPS